MKFVYVIVFALMAGVVSAAAQVSDEAAAIRVPLNNYIKGHATGDGEYMKKAFHTEGNLIFVRDGKVVTRSFADYIAGFTGKPSPDEDQRRRYIASVEASGNAAVAKVVLSYPTADIIDYMSLLKINGEWKIVNKIFYSQPKAATVDKK